MVFLTVNNISVRFFGELVLHHCSWEIKQDEQWAILGPNGSGKTTLVKTLWGGVPTSSGFINYHFLKEKHPSLDQVKKHIGYVSFELHQLLADHLSNQDEWQAFSANVLEKTSVREIISWDGIYGEKAVVSAASIIGIFHLLNREASTLSSGEMRKTLIARSLVKSPKLLILDEPFDGLDENSRLDLKASIAKLLTGKIHLILVTHRYDEILPQITHILAIKDGIIMFEGTKTDALTKDKLNKLYGYGIKPPQFLINRKVGFTQKGASIIEMKDVRVKYGNVTVLSHITWTMRKGENWAILGPNGSGKSTLLELITGDNPQAYSNNVKVFGKKRGSGENLWDIRERIGLVSPKLQLTYRKNMSAFDVIASGFYNSIGLYHHPTDDQSKKVQKIIKDFNLVTLKEKRFTSLSYGQKRMVLLARALVKEPELLILDEPCHGLDMVNRKMILEVIQKIGESGKTNILFVTHQKDEIIPCISNILKLRN